MAISHLIKRISMLTNASPCGQPWLVLAIHDLISRCDLPGARVPPSEWIASRACTRYYDR